MLALYHDSKCGQSLGGSSEYGIDHGRPFNFPLGRDSPVVVETSTVSGPGTPSTPQLPFQTPQILSNRDQPFHRCTLGGLG